MRKIDFSEIEAWEAFEDLAADYFREIRYMSRTEIGLQ